MISYRTHKHDINNFVYKTDSYLAKPYSESKIMKGFFFFFMTILSILCSEEFYGFTKFI